MKKLYMAYVLLNAVILSFSGCVTVGHLSMVILIFSS